MWLARTIGFVTSQRRARTAMVIRSTQVLHVSCQIGVCPGAIDDIHVKHDNNRAAGNIRHVLLSLPRSKMVSNNRYLTQDCHHTLSSSHSSVLSVGVPG